MASIKPKLLPLDYAFWGVLENKKNATFYPNIVLLKTATEEEWEVCRLFRRRAETKIEKNDGNTELIYCFVSILLFCGSFF